MEMLSRNELRAPPLAQTYTAESRDQYDNKIADVTSTTTIAIAPDGSCTGSTCTASVTGTHTVTGSNAGKSGTASLQVSAGALDHIVISPASATISAGTSQTYTAQGFEAANNSLGDVWPSRHSRSLRRGPALGASAPRTPAVLTR